MVNDVSFRALDLSIHRLTDFPTFGLPVFWSSRLFHKYSLKISSTILLFLLWISLSE